MARSSSGFPQRVLTLTNHAPRAVASRYLPTGPVGGRSARRRASGSSAAGNADASACVIAATTAGCGSCSNLGWPGRSPPGQANSASKKDITPVDDLVGLQGTGGAPRDDDVPVLD